MMMVGSATPKIKRGCPPKIEWMIPHIAVEARVSTVLIAPSVNSIYQQMNPTYIT